MSKINDGGLAFPASRFERTPDRNSLSGFASVEVHYPGMSLRDWFAGKFLTGAAGDNAPLDVSVAADQSDIDAALMAHWGAVARAAYIAADAMLVARALASAGQPS